MKYFDYDQEQIQRSNKVPYDSEPITRSRSYKPTSPKSSGGANKVVVFLLIVLIAFNLVLGIMVFRSNLDNGGRVTVENYYNIDDGASANSTYMTSKALPSAVCIASGYNTTVTSNNISYENFQQMNDKGSGVITAIDKDEGSATIVTCEHVVSGNEDSIYILLFDSYKPIKATYIGGVREKDIAVLKIYSSSEVSSSSAVACSVGNSMYLTYGNPVLAVGNPIAGGFDTSFGIVRKAQTLVTVPSVGVERVIAIDVPINSGNSGGGLFNEQGELVGIVNAKIENVAIDNYSYAIPSTLAMSIASSIETNRGIARKASLGLEFMISDEGRDALIINGNTIMIDTVVAKNIVEGSAADRAGILDGDVVIGFTYHNNISVDMISMYSFEDHAYRIGVGDTVTFTIKRNSSTISLTVTISEVV